LAGLNEHWLLVAEPTAQPPMGPGAGLPAVLLLETGDVITRLEKFLALMRADRQGA
jgi:hypothetical protein